MNWRQRGFPTLRGNVSAADNGASGCGWREVDISGGGFEEEPDEGGYIRSRKDRQRSEVALRIQEAGDFFRKAIGIFHVREMRGVELDIARSGNMVRQKAPVGGSGGGIVRSRDDKRRSEDFAELLAKIEIANSGAARDVAFGVD